MKAKLIMIAIRFIMGAIALGLGIWYLSASIGGAALTYTSMDGFLSAIGAGDDIAGANGCILCGYVAELFSIIGNATEMFWRTMLDGIWILMAVGFGIYMFIFTIGYLWAAAKKTNTTDTSEQKLEFKSWFDKVWRLGLRIVIVGTLIGAIGMGGTGALKTVANITIRPVLFVGAELAMAASGVADSATCGAMANMATGGDILSPILAPFMCVMGNLNTVMLAGAAGGFAMMNYAWLGMGGGAFTWIAGLALVIMFLIIGFDLFFQILSVVFKLIFLIIFLPLLLAATAFESAWKLAGGLVKNAINMLVSSAVRIVAITLKIVIIYATVSFAADMCFPGPRDGFSAVLPPMLGVAENPDAQTLSVMRVFSTCESVAMNGGKMDAEKFKNCFTARRSEVERKYPGAFDFLHDGWDFLFMMFGLFLLYYFAISPRVDKLLPAGKVALPIPGEDASLATGEQFDFGAWTYDLGKKIWHAPQQIAEKIVNAVAKKD